MRVQLIYHEFDFNSRTARKALPYQQLCAWHWHINNVTTTSTTSPPHQQHRRRINNIAATIVDAAIVAACRGSP
jgi:hypothetical protein